MSGGPVRVEIDVAWGEMDAFRHVNNAVYARWLETARIAYFERVGLLAYDSVGPILARQAIDFRKPIEFPDRVTVEVHVPRLGTSSFQMRYQVTSRAQGGALVAEGESIIVLYDYKQGVKVPLSDALRAAIDGLEGR
jgi:acyl-CoA thioester hydrolase